MWLSAHTYTRFNSIACVFSAVPIFLLHHTPTFQEQTFLELKSFLDCLPRPLALPLSHSMPLYCVWKHLGYGFIPCDPTTYKVLFSSSPSPTFFFYWWYTVSELFCFLSIPEICRNGLWLFISINFKFSSLLLVSFPLDNFDIIVSWTLNFWILLFIWKWCLSMSVVVLLLLFLKQVLSHCCPSWPGRPGTHSVACSDLEFLGILLQPYKC